MDECDWTRCAAPARLDVLLGQTLVGAERVGAYCVPHASLCSMDTQDRAGEPTWYDWHRPRLRDKLADAVGEHARVIPLFRAADRERGRRLGGATWAGTTGTVSSLGTTGSDLADP
jgi:hypothetical protein